MDLLVEQHFMNLPDSRKFFQNELFGNGKRPGHSVKNPVFSSASPPFQSGDFAGLVDALVPFPTVNPGGK